MQTCMHRFVRTWRDTPQLQLKFGEVKTRICMLCRGTPLSDLPQCIAMLVHQRVHGLSDATPAALRSWNWARFLQSPQVFRFGLLEPWQKWLPAPSPSMCRTTCWRTSVCGCNVRGWCPTMWERACGIPTELGPMERTRWHWKNMCYLDPVGNAFLKKIPEKETFFFQSWPPICIYSFTNKWYPKNGDLHTLNARKWRYQSNGLVIVAVHFISTSCIQHMGWQ